MDNGRPSEVVDGGHWREDGTFEAPPGWPEGAGWVVRDPDGSIVDSGPASDLHLAVTTDTGDEGPMPPASQLSVAWHTAPPDEGAAE